MLWLSSSTSYFATNFMALRSIIRMRFKAAAAAAAAADDNDDDDDCLLY